MKLKKPTVHIDEFEIFFVRNFDNLYLLLYGVVSVAVFYDFLSSYSFFSTFFPVFSPILWSIPQTLCLEMPYFFPIWGMV